MKTKFKSGYCKTCKAFEPFDHDYELKGLWACECKPKKVKTSDVLKKVEKYLDAKNKICNNKLNQ